MFGYVFGFVAGTVTTYICLKGQFKQFDKVLREIHQDLKLLKNRRGIHMRTPEEIVADNLDIAMQGIKVIVSLQSSSKESKEAVNHVTTLCEGARTIIEFGVDEEGQGLEKDIIKTLNGVIANLRILQAHPEVTEESITIYQGAEACIEHIKNNYRRLKGGKSISKEWWDKPIKGEKDVLQR